MKISNTIKNLREQQGLSIRKLAQVSDVAAAFISCIEKGTKSPSPTTLEKLAPNLGVTYEYLMFVAGFIKPDIKLLKTTEDTKSSSVIMSLIQDLLKKRIIEDENNIPEDVMNILISAIKIEIKLQNKQLKK